jgi:hypothetical protein
MLILGLGIIPIFVFGPSRTRTYYQEWDRALRQPALANGRDESRANELINMTATDSQSFIVMLHNTLHLERATRPAKPSDTLRRLHWLIGGCFLAATMLFAGRQPLKPVAEMILVGGLVLLMILLSPVCHLHYFCLLLPLVCGLLTAGRLIGASGWLRYVTTLAIAVNCVASALPHFPGLEVLRDIGLVSYTALLLWLVGMVHVRKSRGQGQDPATANLRLLNRAA